MSVVYIIAASAAGPCKIGWTGSGVTSRVAALQCGNPDELLVYGYVAARAARRVELEAHRKLERCRVRGEWFAVSVAEAGETLRRCSLDVGGADILWLITEDVWVKRLRGGPAGSTFEVPADRDWSKPLVCVA